MSHSSPSVDPVAQRGASDDTSSRSTLVASQNAANRAPGPRRVPARVVPIPRTDLSPAAQALVAAPYGLAVSWDANPRSADEWRRLVRGSAVATERVLADARAALGVSVEKTTLGEVPCYVLTPRVVPEAHRDHLIVNAHGGGYVFGPGMSGTAEAMLMAAYGGYRVLAFDYRMPPDAPYPAAMDDAMSVWRAAVAAHDPRRMAVVGTSAGGGMVLATVLRAKQEGLPLPACIAPSTPWADLTETGDSYKTNEWVDNVLVSYSGYLGRAARLYANGRDLRDPQLSPVYGDFAGFPPAILTAGTRDLFLSNTVRVHRKLRRAGVEAELQVFEGLSHAQFIFDPVAPETREIFAEIARFFDKHLAP